MKHVILLALIFLSAISFIDHNSSALTLEEWDKLASKENCDSLPDRLVDACKRPQDRISGCKETAYSCQFPTDLMKKYQLAKDNFSRTPDSESQKKQELKAQLDNMERELRQIKEVFIRRREEWQICTNARHDVRSAFKDAIDIAAYDASNSPEKREKAEVMQHRWEQSYEQHGQAIENWKKASDNCDDYAGKLSSF